MTSLVLDSWALLAWLGGEEPAASRVAELLEAAVNEAAELEMCLINAGEVFYTIGKKLGLAEAQRVRQTLLAAPITYVSVGDALVWQAAELKARHAIAYADAFAAALAAIRGWPLMTGDPEFQALERERDIRVHWLERAQ